MCLSSIDFTFSRQCCFGTWELGYLKAKKKKKTDSGSHEQ